MITAYRNYIQKFEEDSFIKASKRDIKKINKLIDKKYKLPEGFIELYSDFYPNKEIEICEDVVIYPFERIKDENTDYVPGSAINQYGFFIFASTLDGDAICIDLNDPNYGIYQFSHDLLDSDEEISFYVKNKGMIEIKVSYDNIINCSVKIAESFNEFVQKIINSESVTCDVVTEVIEKYR